MFIVADEAPVEQQDPVCLFHDPPLGLWDEAGVGRVAFDDLDVDAQVLAVVDDALLEPLVDQGLLDGVALDGHAVQQRDAGGVVVRGRGQDDGLDDQARHVYGQASLPARHSFRSVLAGRAGRDADGGVDALGIHHDEARVG